jgi:hypothetical protein
MILPWEGWQSLGCAEDLTKSAQILITKLLSPRTIILIPRTISGRDINSILFSFTVHILMASVCDTASVA